MICIESRLIELTPSVALGALLSGFLSTLLVSSVPFVPMNVLTMVTAFFLLSLMVLAIITVTRNSESISRAFIVVAVLSANKSLLRHRLS